jgi:hypothetical protein
LQARYVRNQQQLPHDLMDTDRSAWIETDRSAWTVAIVAAEFHSAEVPHDLMDTDRLAWIENRQISVDYCNSCSRVAFCRWFVFRDRMTKYDCYGTIWRDYDKNRL